MRQFALLAAIALAVLAVGGVASASRATTTLTGAVGPDDTITLTRAGHAVHSLAPGRYTVVVKDLATDHNFHLFGPGVAKTTSVGGTGTTRWTVTLKKGTYRFQCDPHATFMKGTFKVT